MNNNLGVMLVNQITLKTLFTLFFIAIILDFISGILASAKEGRLKSRTCSNGMFRSIGECLVLFMFMTVSKYVPSLEEMFKVFMLGFIFKETLSIVENLVRLDVWIPESIKKLLEVGADRVDKGGK